MKTGIYGGSFDPPHIEHINSALCAIKNLGLDRLIIVPANLPPHKPSAVLTIGADRLNMLKLAFKDEPRVQVSDFELSSGGKSYTYLTIEHFSRIYPGDELYFLVGADMLDDFPTWKNPSEILDRAILAVSGREGENLSAATDKFFSSFKCAKDRIVFSPYTGKAVSSTDIRCRLLLGLDASPYLTAPVLDYIAENKLYIGGVKAKFVRENLPISRLTHTLGVMELSKIYARRLKEDENKAMRAAMLHDCAKYLSPADYPDFKLDSDVPAPVVHQFLGAYIAENILGETDKGVLSAIRYHTTGRAAMTTLEKIVFLADLLEMGRSYPEVDILRAAVNEDFDRGFSFCVGKVMEFLTAKPGVIYRLTKECYDYYVTGGGK